IPSGSGARDVKQLHIHLTKRKAQVDDSFRLQQDITHLHKYRCFFLDTLCEGAYLLRNGHKDA
ncbi:hypothetical protein ACQ7B2_12320, partial [Escherichia coli]